MNFQKCGPNILYLRRKNANPDECCPTLTPQSYICSYRYHCICIYSAYYIILIPARRIGASVRVYNLASRHCVIPDLVPYLASLQSITRIWQPSSCPLLTSGVYLPAELLGANAPRQQRGGRPTDRPCVFTWPQPLLHSVITQRLLVGLKIKYRNKLNIENKLNLIIWGNFVITMSLINIF